MHHVAILRKAKIKKGDNLLQDILSGQKTIESRWYVNKIAPWGRINPGETVYFKESGCPVTSKAIVSKVLQFSNLSSELINDIILKYGKKIAPHNTLDELYKWGSTLASKRYCILVFLKDVEKVKPFQIDKTGFGNAAAWLTFADAPLPV